MAKQSRAYQEADALMPTKSSPPHDAAAGVQSQHVTHAAPPSTSRVAFRNHLTQPSIASAAATASVPSEESMQRQPQHPLPPVALRPNGDMNGYAPVVQAAKKVVSWNDAPVAQPGVQAPADVAANGTSGITLEDIDEVLGSSTEQDEPSALLPNTPNVIGSQEVYRDPRERMMQEKMKNKLQAVAQGPEKLTFKEKMQMFAIQQNAASASAAGHKVASMSSSLKSSSSSNAAMTTGVASAKDTENGNANACIPEEET